MNIHAASGAAVQECSGVRPALATCCGEFLLSWGQARMCSRRSV
jgi:hypothetical protein